MVRESQTGDYWGVEALSPNEGVKLDEGEIDDVYDVNAYVYSGGREGVRVLTEALYIVGSIQLIWRGFTLCFDVLYPVLVSSIIPFVPSGTSKHFIQCINESLGPSCLSLFLTSLPFFGSGTEHHDGGCETSQ
jgi:hypothetical protein